MIAYFPEMYPDELSYSIMCRLYAHMGLTSGSRAKEYIYGSRCAGVDSYGIGNISDDIMDAIKRRMSTEDYVINHTMFPFLTAFYKYDYKENLFKCACKKMDIYYIYSQEKHHIKYCPLCAADDINKYGEAFFHRKHQLLTSCTRHKIELLFVDISKKTYPNTLVPLADAVSNIYEPACYDSLKYSEYVESFIEYTIKDYGSFSFDCNELKSEVLSNIDMFSEYFKNAYVKRHRKNVVRGLLGDLDDCKADVIMKVAYLLKIPISELFFVSEK